MWLTYGNIDVSFEPHSLKTGSNMQAHASVELYEELVAEGVSILSANIALHLRESIMRIDSIIFKDSAISVDVLSRKDVNGSSTQYIPDHEDTYHPALERYEIFAPSWTQESIGQEMLRVRNGLIVSEPCTDYSLVLLSIAAHEVRHRMQDQMPKLRLFENKFSARSDVLRANIAVCVMKDIEDTRGRLLSDCKPESIIRDQIKPEEFDARFVAYLVLAWPYDEITDIALRNILHLQSPV